MKQKLFSIIALLLMAATGAWAQGPWTSGDCTVTLSNGTMTVSGKGAMANLVSEQQPWDNYKNDITSVVVESGVTAIGTGVFDNFKNMTSVTLPEGLTSIGNHAFYSCSSLTSITIPSTVTSIGIDTFWGCEGMTDVYLYADPANLTWAEDACDDFKYFPQGSTQCHVLAEHLSAYETKFTGVVNVTFVGDLKPLTPSTYSITLAEGTEDFDNWTISPTEATAGSPVTATYKGEKKVKSVKAVKKANVWDGDLSKLTAESTPEYATATDGMTITGTLAEGVNVKVSIADKATVTLDNVTINGVHKGDLDYMWAGLTCLGDATIILKDGTENKITGFHDHFPAIYIPGDRHNPENNKTLIIKGGEQGTGKLIARNNGYAAAIGGVKSDASLNQLTLSAGNIEIQGGDIEAYAGEYCAAIGAAASDTCGYIRITGGKILANGSNYGVGIGCGTGMNELSQEAHCGDITITGGNITAFGGGGAAIGSCVDGVCGNITISGGIVMAVGQRFGSPGIGSGYKERFETRCGDILINGGVIQAVGLISAPGIGCGGTGDQSGTCGNITITSGVTKLYAERGTGATNSIGLADNEGQCGTVTIGGTVYWQNGSYVGEGLDYLQQNPIQYEP